MLAFTYWTQLKPKGQRGQKVEWSECHIWYPCTPCFLDFQNVCFSSHHLTLIFLLQEKYYFPSFPPGGVLARGGAN